MGAPVDLSGQKFGNVIALEPTKRRKPNGEVLWKCQCDCGTVFYTGTGTLRYGSTQSCGCSRLNHLTEKPPRRTHGNSKNRLYGIWRGMIDRCYYPSHNRYHVYGGRGIRICDEWKNDFSIFRDWAMANGYDPSAPRGKCTIDRIDVNGNYEPSNCRWVDMKTQIHNKQKAGEF